MSKLRKTKVATLEQRGSFITKAFCEILMEYVVMEFFQQKLLCNICNINRNADETDYTQTHRVKAKICIIRVVRVPMIGLRVLIGKNIKWTYLKLIKK